MDNTDTILIAILAIVVIAFSGVIGWGIGNNQTQQEAILTRNAHWETLPNGHTIFKWNDNK